MKIELRPYQIAAASAFFSGLSTAQRQIITLPTGTGKTILGLAMAKKINGRVLWLAHRDELIQQPYDTCAHVWPEVRRGIVKAARDEYDAQIVFASIQTAQNKKRLANLKGFDFVVADECHHATSSSWYRVIEAMGCFAEDGPPLLGITATPERTDNQRLDKVFERIAYSYHLPQAIHDGYLVPIKHLEVPIELDLDGVKVCRNGDFDESALNDALLDAGIVDAICDAVRANPDRRIVVFTVSVDQARKVATRLNDLGIPAGSVDGETPAELRRARLRRFAAGDLRVISNCMVLTEGWDCPSADCAIMARPTTSKPLYIQCIGRVLRIAPNKQEAIVIDMVGASRQHSLIQAPVLFGEDKNQQGGRRTYAADEDIAQWNNRMRLLGQFNGLEPVTRSNMRWVNCSDATIAISAGRGGTVIARRQLDDLWNVIAATYGGVEIIVSGADISLAQGLAEDYVRRCEASGWVEKGARWRSHQATPKQVELIKKSGHKVDGKKITKGQASDLITQSIATSWRYEPATKKQLAAMIRLGLECGPDTTKQEARRAIYECR